MLDAQFDAIKPSESLLVTGEYYGILASLVNAHTIVRKRLRGVEIEHEENACAFEHDNLVDFMLQGHIRLS